MNRTFSKITLAAVMACMAAGSAFPAVAAEAEDGVFRTAVLYDLSTMDVAKTTDNYLVPLNSPLRTVSSFPMEVLLPLRM